MTKREKLAKNLRAIGLCEEVMDMYGGWDELEEEQKNVYLRMADFVIAREANNGRT